MSLKDEWKETGKNLGSAMSDLGKSIGKSAGKAALSCWLQPVNNAVQSNSTATLYTKYFFIVCPSRL